jgi:DNA polymerase III delta prime subunit
MPLDDLQKRRLADTGEQVLTALDTVAAAIQLKLSEVMQAVDGSVLAGSQNPMVGRLTAPVRLAAIRGADREHLERLHREPFVARVVVEWGSGPEAGEQTFYMTRASAAGVGNVASPAKLVTYVAALGRLAELSPDDTAIIPIDGVRREVKIRERVRLRPENHDDAWDALDNKFDFPLWGTSIESLREFLEQLRPVTEELDIVSAVRKKAAEADLARKALQRRVIDRISLRDQPILDRYQGDVFRMPLDRRLLLLGPPGTGKTTTLIRRLAQKRMPEALSEEEEALLSTTGLREQFSSPQSWAMFSPTELLSLYLRDAFNREGVAAVDGVNLRTWGRERIELGRNVLGILRSADSGVFQLDERVQLVTEESSSLLSSLFQALSAFVESTVLDQTTGALQSIGESKDAGVADSARRLRRLIGAHDPLVLRDITRLVDAGPEILQPETRRLDDESRAEVDRSVRRLLSQHRTLLDDLTAALPGLTTDERRVTDDDDEDDEAEDLRPTRDPQLQALESLTAAIRAQARAAALSRPSVSGRAGRIVDFVGDRMPPIPEMTSLGLQLLTRDHLRRLRQAPQRLVMGVPRFYAAFRRQALREGRFFRVDSSDALKQGRISPAETDIIILTMLRNARALQAEPFTSSPDWVEAIRSRYLLQVFVDEATDFSAIQLACMMELCHPRLRSWFACGDFLQRITSYGVRDTSEIAQLAPEGQPIETRVVRIDYRQSRRLRHLATALAGNDPLRAEPPESGGDADIWPLLTEGHTGDELGDWLSRRILEVEQAIGRLPSIGVFVDGDDRIDAVVRATQPGLENRNLRIVACRDGRVVGDAREVRVFDVRHIKGLEFEAVFFVGIDRLAERLPDLFDRYLYVGITRAATYLGVTCERSLPTRLASVRSHFAEAAARPW